MPHEDELYVVLQIAEVVPFAKSRLAFENGEPFAIVTGDRLGPLAWPAKVPLDKSRLRVLYDTPAGSPQYRYLDEIPSPRES